MTNHLNSHCSYCGHEFVVDSWPRQCEQCKNISYINPKPVTVLLVPVENRGILTVRRGEEPGKGGLALPGGFMDPNESWEEGAVRELREETGISLDPRDVKLSHLVTIPSNHLLIFCNTREVLTKSLDNFRPNKEVSELVIVSEETELVFSTHTDALKKYLSISNFNTCI